MIRGENNSNRVLTPLEFIGVSSIQFDLTGSRFFGTFKEDSDYDFFTDYSEETYKILMDFGFKDTSEDYNGPGITRVMEMGNVHVQLVTSSREKRFIQYHLLQYIRAYKPSKLQCATLWHLALKLYGSGKAEGVAVTTKKVITGELSR